MKVNKTSVWTFSKGDRFLGGRPRGAELRIEILEALARLPGDDVLSMNFSSVQFMDFSAADEILTPLVGRTTSGELGTRRFCLTGVNPAVRESISAVMRLRKRHCLEIDSSGTPKVIGPMSREHLETLEWVSQQGEASVSDVAGHFWNPPKMTAATNRLNMLAASGLLLKISEQGGPAREKYVYRAFLTPPSQTPKRSKRKKV